MTEATPRPWFYSPWHNEEGPSAVRAGESFINSWIVCTTASDADAALIVRAVNNYDEALELLRDNRHELRRLLDVVGDADYDLVLAAIDRIDAFLAKEKGQ